MANIVTQFTPLPIFKLQTPIIRPIHYRQLPEELDDELQMNPLSYHIDSETVLKERALWHEGL